MSKAASSRRLLFGFDPGVAAWVCERIPHVRDFGPCAAIGVMTGGRLVAGVVYHDYQPDFGSVQLSMAADSSTWARRELIAGLLHYPFEQLGCWSVFTLTPEDNKKAVKVNEHIGFKKKTILPHAFGKKRHAVFCQMLKPDYIDRYGDLNGEIQPIAAARA